ncbi:maleylpyruvate isomerase N-terminal domain-containing protein [Mycolicibacterium litorale]|uniref:maleylpyruvate isomerase N-terminal domain-containing protein n=1 Tax=Mycolicibacterium litorale TaxID=758802 RepID=UPI0039A3D3A3
MTSVRALARLERLEFADLLDGLSSAQWATPSLCDGWTVREVAAHTVAYLAQGRIGLAAGMIRHRCDVDRLNADGVRRHAALDHTELARRMRCDTEPAGAGGTRAACGWWRPIWTGRQAAAPTWPAAGKRWR